ncbi:unnamed protein product [Linum trigynum]|uniref:Uncharacterized protein n=1 Tax=Linum trigynum TaxID=586398 RepID=A0AAV2EZ31_9ROSI
MAAAELAKSMIFTRCLIQDQLGLVLIDGGRESNLISLRIVSKLKLQLQPHPAPYVVQSPYEDKFNMVVSQVAVTFSIGQYEDRVLCDVVLNLPSSIVLGQPWFRDRQVRFASRRSKKFRFHSRNKVFVLSPLTPEAVAEDLRVLQGLQEEYQSSLVAKSSSMGGNSVQTSLSNKSPCFAPTKQSSELGSPADVAEGKMAHEVGPKESLQVEVTMRIQVESLDGADSDRISPSTSTLEIYNVTAKQRKREGQLAGLIGEASSRSKEISTLPYASGSSPLDQMKTNHSVFHNQNRAESALHMLKTEDNASELVGKIGRNPTKTAAAELFVETQGMCGAPEIDQINGETKTPKFDSGFLDTQEFENYNGGKTADDGSTLTRGIRSLGMQWEIDLKERQEDSSIELKNRSWDSDSGQWQVFEHEEKLGDMVGAIRRESTPKANVASLGVLPVICKKLQTRPAMLDPKTPTLRRSSRCRELSGYGKVQNCILGVFVPIDRKKGAQWSPMLMQEMEFRPKTAGPRAYEAANVLQKFEFEKPSFDPIWDQFCVCFEQRKAKVLRSTLFQEGGPDMIPNCQLFTSQLLDKEAIKVGKKKGRIWLSQNPCSG